VQAAKLIDADSVLAVSFRAREVGAGCFLLNGVLGVASSMPGFAPVTRSVRSPAAIDNH
jgi:hypothetical protein